MEYLGERYDLAIGTQPKWNRATCRSSRCHSLLTAATFWRLSVPFVGVVSRNDSVWSGNSVYCVIEGKDDRSRCPSEGTPNETDEQCGERNYVHDVSIKKLNVDLVRSRTDCKTQEYWSV